MKIRFFNQKGSALIEYAVILSFVAVISTGFISDDGITKSASSIINTVASILDGTYQKSDNIIRDSSTILDGKYLNGASNDIFGSSRKDVYSIVGSDEKLFYLEDGEYELVVDRNKVDEIAKEYGVSNIETNFWVCVLLYGDGEGTGKANFDTSGQYLDRPKNNTSSLKNFSQVIEQDKTTFKFTVDSSTGNYLGINIGKNGSDNTNTNDALYGLGANYKEILTVNKVK